MIKIQSSKCIKEQDAPNNILWLDLFGYIRYLEFHLEELKRVPLVKRDDSIRYRMRYLRDEIKYLNAWFKGDLK